MINMPKETVDVMVEGGKATAAPPIGPALSPLKVNVAKVVEEINSKTKAFAGMQVPVKIVVDTVSKEFIIGNSTDIWDPEIDAIDESVERLLAQLDSLALKLFL